MATSKLNTDSPVSRRIVLAFLDFLNSVEPAPGIDLEGLEVVRECLGEVFKLNSSSSNGQTKPNLLVDYFSSLDENKQKEIKADQCPTSTSGDAPSTSTQNASAYDTNPSASSKPLGEDMAGEPHALGGVSKDELFGQFFGALENIYFFNTTTDGNEDPAQLDKATNLFHDAVLEMERSGCQLNSTNLADTFKSKGNKAMQLKLYNDAIELYTYAIAVCENNSVYYCNRAAAFTQIHKYMEAIRDCYKSIEIDPSYSKAYSRLGLAYYAQGNYSDAINKGFLRALLLDPNSVSIRENIRVAEQKLIEETQRTGQDQNAGSTTHNNQVPGGQSTGGGSRSTGVPPSFMSSAFNSGVLPADMANMFMNIAGNTFQGQQPSQERPVNGSHTFQFNEPEIRMSGNVNLNVGEEVPEELMGTWRSVMGMFQGAQPHQPQQGDTNRGPTPPTN